ncbi:MAG: bifunctional alpha,alpha-trehalose-phosphate synthase (UDP-forming)/trehalose-phosphatase [Spirochaetaceae bacterium]|nr:MAG: bifunctional alpha,alpha-trehalose-phosphate synthase (UDP-forming)/trehalose-phosphatase [Spirochaetaceae bacterium]
MGKIVLVSNRLSTSVTLDADGPGFAPSMGGLATGLSSMHQQENSLWVGWTGIPADNVSAEMSQVIADRLRQEYKSVAVPLTADEIEDFYFGFCNNIIWPLFHYFPTYADYDEALWEAYRRVNEKYYHKVVEVADEDDFIWVHDYQLMLLPQMIKSALPASRIGFFLHIPFPSYEVFRLLPWREQVLDGLLGADLVGFHTYDYARHFLSAVRRILSAEHQMANVKYHNRMVKVDAFPMGIDYQKYATARELPAVQQEIANIRRELAGQRIILSVDRLDYSKGIPIRIRAYRSFLEQNPDYHGKVTMILIVAPSRTAVPHYQELKREIDELVSVTNGTLGRIGWTPISYFYRPFPFDQLTATYTQSDVLLVTPLRDGMNLIAKEYIAARTDYRGVIVLSETAGAARELGEAITINPNNEPQIAAAIREALEMTIEEQEQKNRLMHERLELYDIHYWARDFMDKLAAVGEMQASFAQRAFGKRQQERLIADYEAAGRRLIFVDYDGTLLDREHRSHKLSSESIDDMAALASDPCNEVVVISGRPKDYLQEVFHDLPVGIIAGHGIWYKGKSDTWHTTEQISNDWKQTILPILQLYCNRTPGTKVEESDYSLVWNYRRAQPELAAVRLSELKDALISLTANHDLSILERSHILELKHSNVNKGRAAAAWYEGSDWDFVLAIGDDWTDEDMFAMLSEEQYTIKVGIDISQARFFVNSTEDVRQLLGELARRSRFKTAS